MDSEIQNELLAKMDSTEVQEFIENRKIQADAIALIEKLVLFPKDFIIIEFHNFFNSYRDRSGKELECLVENAKDDTKRDLYKTLLEFYNKTGWAICYNLIRVLERI
jgi:hypothetical protein